MADIYGSHFEFAGISSREYSLIIANVETTRVTQLAGTISGNTIFSRKDKKLYLTDDDYADSPLSFEVDIVTDNGRCLEPGERRHIYKWLFNRRDYRKMYLDIADDCLGETYEFVDGVMKRNYMNCRLINPEKIEYNGGIVGYKATLETDSGMFWQDPIKKEYNVGNSSATAISNITVNVDTDMDDYIYPKVTFKMGGVGGRVLITNNHDDSTRITEFDEISPDASVTMKGDLNYISEQYYEKFCRKNFIRLLDGINIFTIIGNVDSVTFEFSQRRAL